LAEKFLEDGRELVSKDPIQASEKLYKATEECIKALAIHLGLEDITRKAGERGRWTVTELEKAVEAISDRVGEWFRETWDSAWLLHVLGFHEAKYSIEDVEDDVKYVEWMVKYTKEVLERSRNQ